MNTKLQTQLNFMFTNQISLQPHKQSEAPPEGQMHVGTLKNHSLIGGQQTEPCKNFDTIASWRQGRKGVNPEQPKTGKGKTNSRTFFPSLPKTKKGTKALQNLHENKDSALVTSQLVHSSRATRSSRVLTFSLKFKKKKGGILYFEVLLMQ